MKLEKLKPGDVVYSTARVRMGNTTMSRMACWSVRIVSVDLDAQTVEASWNANAARVYRRRDWSKWRYSPLKERA